MELLDLYDVNRIPLGKTMARGDKQPLDTYRLVVHVCIFSPDGKMLCQRRHPNKKSWAGMWDVSVGGHSVSGETSLDTAQRETFEELGIRLPNNVIPAVTVNFNGGFDDFYCVNMDVQISDCTLQQEEVAEVAYLSLEEICQMIDNGTFIPRNKGFVEYLFYCRNRRGLVKEVIHHMNLQQDPFDQIVSGVKTIELRLNDDKRRKVNVGDLIEFTCNGHTARVRVTELHPFNSFEALYHNLDLVKCGYAPHELSTAKASDMLHYYNAEQQQQWGVLGIEFTLLSVN